MIYNTILRLIAEECADKYLGSYARVITYVNTLCAYYAARNASFITSERAMPLFSELRVSYTRLS